MFWDSNRAREMVGLERDDEVGFRGLGLWVMRKEVKK